jgi:hypothetical protein
MEFLGSNLFTNVLLSVIAVDLYFESKKTHNLLRSPPF